jgi:hypothetical protein
MKSSRKKSHSIIIAQKRPAARARKGPGKLDGDGSASLLTFMRSFTAMSIVLGLTVKLPPVFCRVLAARWETTVISFTEIIVMIYMSVETLRSVEPGTGTDEYTALEPLRAVVAIGGTVVRRNLVVSVRTNRRGTDTDRNLRWRVWGGSHKKTRRDSHQTYMSQYFHRIT